jgi:predicted RNase H-like HicB family nuclease
MDLTMMLEPCEEGGYHVWVPALPGCHSEGDTEKKAIANIREAVRLYLAPDGAPCLAPTANLRAGWIPPA